MATSQVTKLRKQLNDFSAAKIETILPRVVALPGLKYSRSLTARGCDADVDTGCDGERIACLFFAEGTIALSEQIVWAADAHESGHLQVLWVLDNDICACSYRFTDDICDYFCNVSKRAESHVHLAEEERLAWQHAAANAEHIGAFAFCVLSRYKLEACTNH